MRHSATLLRSVMIAGAITGSPSRAQMDTSSQWRPMIFQDLRTPSKTDTLQSLVWPDAIAEANAYVTSELKQPLNGMNAPITALSSTYAKGDRTIIVSVISMRGCDHGANDKRAVIEPSICPLRIVVIRNGKIAGAKTDTGCYVDHEDPDLPVLNREDNSYSRFDVASGVIELRTSVGGRNIPRCARKYSID